MTAEPSAITADERRILIVDDDPDAREILRRMLGSAGYEVLEATDATRALALLGSHLGVNAVITDVRMPGDLDGIGLADYISLAWPQIAVVVVSGADYAIPTYKHNLTFLQKPYECPALIQHLERELAKCALLR